MTNTKLIKLEKEIEKKIEIPKTKKTNRKFVVDVAGLKKLARRINEYEEQANVAAQH